LIPKPPKRSPRMSRRGRKKLARTYICQDCGLYDKAGERGRVKERCPACAMKRTRILSRIWAKDNPEVVRDRAKSWRERNKKHCLEKAREYRSTHREELRIYNTAYQRARRARLKLLKAIEESQEES